MQGLQGFPGASGAKGKKISSKKSSFEEHLKCKTSLELVFKFCKGYLFYYLLKLFLKH